MSLYKRGNIWWTAFVRQGKRYQFSTKTRDKAEARRREKLMMGERDRIEFDVYLRKIRALQGGAR